MKRALIVGSAPCVFDDLIDAPRWPIIAINYAGLRNTGPIELWVSLHFRLLAQLIEQREKMGGDMNFKAFSKVPREDIVSCGIPIQPAPTGRVGNGSSGLLAVFTAIQEGYEQLILCGVPMEGNETLQANDKIETRTRGRRGMDAFERFRHPWKLNEKIIRQHVRSMSGWTREFFGGIDEPFA